MTIMAIKIGLQLYTVSKYVTANMEDALEKVAKGGYAGVEFAGYCGFKAGDLRKKLDSLGLRAAGAHVDFGSLAHNPDSQLGYARELGMDYVTVPYLDKNMLQDPKVASRLNDICEVAKKYNIKICYHNHDEVFDMKGEKNLLEHLLDAVPELNVELDTYWAQFAGEEPIAYMKKLGSRLSQLHIKDMDKVSPKDEKGNLRPNPNIGEGCMDIKGILKLGGKMGIEWAFVEMDNSSGDQMECSVKSMQNLIKMGY